MSKEGEIVHRNVEDKSVETSTTQEEEEAAKNASVQVTPTIVQELSQEEDHANYGPWMIVKRNSSRRSRAKKGEDISGMNSLQVNEDTMAVRCQTLQTLSNEYYKLEL
ncbi:hypothetical protein P8452_21619 [Trifolium repens]|nr:hypothetical protein P8452_21619 [Trifolium repens]